VWEKCNREGVPYTIVAFVHDEDVDDIPRDCLKASNRIQKEAFDETAALLYKNVPFEFESEYGKSWGAKSIAAEMIDLNETE
jgi:DNA polymerase I-like protein with 3'-5' exonuclease and polymerase domains